jgi:hypothetical protein
MVIEGINFTVVLFGILDNDQIGDADPVYAIFQTIELELPDLIPINHQIQLFNAMEQLDNFPLIADSQKRDQFRQNEVIGDNEVFINQGIKFV